jgi:hypothetical protein
MMAVVMMMAPAADGLRQIRNVGKLATLRRSGEIRGELGELVGRGRIPVGGRGLRGTLQIAGDLLGDLLILGWIRLLQLLQGAHQLRER